MSLRIGAISGYGMYGIYPAYGMGAGTGAAGMTAGVAAGMGVGAAGSAEEAGKSHVIRNPGEETRVAPGRKSSPAECETCKNRKYQDGSDEMVSFKTAQHMDPAEAATRVRAHEQEHVANAYDKAAQKNGKVLQASVSIHTAICPECGTTYVSGGTTSTKIKYSNEDNPYQKDRKAQHAEALRGANVDLAV